MVGLYQPHENKTYYDFAGSGWICMYGHEVIIKNNLGCAISGVYVPVCLKFVVIIIIIPNLYSALIMCKHVLGHWTWKNRQTKK